VTRNSPSPKTSYELTRIVAGFAAAAGSKSTFSGLVPSRIASLWTAASGSSRSANSRPPLSSTSRYDTPACDAVSDTVGHRDTKDGF
jgi:hypothetical protein